MSTRREIELLCQVPLFADIDPVQLQVLVFSAQRVEFAAEETLFAAGDLAGAGHLVLNGQGEVLRPKGGEGLEPACVATVDAGAFLGEMAMIANLPAAVTVRAQTPMQVLRIGHDLFLRVCGEFPEIGAKVLEALAHRLETSMEELREAQTQLDGARPFTRS